MGTFLYPSTGNQPQPAYNPGYNQPSAGQDTYKILEEQLWKDPEFAKVLNILKNISSQTNVTKILGHEDEKEEEFIGSLVASCIILVGIYLIWYGLTFKQRLGEGRIQPQTQRTAEEGSTRLAEQPLMSPTAPGMPNPPAYNILFEREKQQKSSDMGEKEPAPPEIGFLMRGD